MARTRQLRPSFFTSPTLAKVTRDARLLFTGLWVEADDQGRLIDSPKRIAGAVFPHDDDVSGDMVTKWLDQLEGIGAVRRYHAGEANMLVIPAFGVHQKVPHPTPSALPAPPEPRTKRTRKPQAHSVNGSSEPHAELASASGENQEPITPYVLVSVSDFVSDLVSSSSSSPSAVDIREPPTEEEEEDQTHKKARQAALVALAEFRLEHTTGKITNVEAWLTATAHNLDIEHAALDAQQILALIKVHGDAELPSVKPADPTQAAQRAIGELGDARRTNPCPECDGDGWVEANIDGALRMVPCPDCAGTGIAP